MSALIEGLGTGEQCWRTWLLSRPWLPLDLRQFAGRRVVVLAAHPDDEVLGVGGLLSHVAAIGTHIVCVWATDGEASHPGSTVFSGAQLAALRRAESTAAISRLGVVPDHAIHLSLPDGGLAGRIDELTSRLRRIIRPDDLILAPWRHDGHPDHEAVGEAAARLDLSLVEYPIWMWHWAAPDDPRVPWHRARGFTTVDVERKAAAIDEFVTQIDPIGPAATDAAILPPPIVERFLRSCELVFQ